MTLLQGRLLVCLEEAPHRLPLTQQHSMWGLKPQGSPAGSYFLLSSQARSSHVDAIGSEEMCVTLHMASQAEQPSLK